MPGAGLLAVRPLGLDFIKQDFKFVEGSRRRGYRCGRRKRTLPRFSFCRHTARSLSTATLIARSTAASSNCGGELGFTGLPDLPLEFGDPAAAHHG
jgi:hypothetical protein